MSWGNLCLRVYVHYSTCAYACAQTRVRMSLLVHLCVPVCAYSSCVQFARAYFSECLGVPGWAWLYICACVRVFACHVITEKKEGHDDRDWSEMTSDTQRSREWRVSVKTSEEKRVCGSEQQQCGQSFCTRWFYGQKKRGRRKRCITVFAHAERGYSIREEWEVVCVSKGCGTQKQLRQRYDEKRTNKKYAKQFETNHRIIVRNLE